MLKRTTLIIPKIYSYHGYKFNCLVTMVKKLTVCSIMTVNYINDCNRKNVSWLIWDMPSSPFMDLPPSSPFMDVPPPPPLWTFPPPPPSWTCPLPLWTCPPPPPLWMIKNNGYKFNCSVTMVKKLTVCSINDGELHK